MQQIGFSSVRKQISLDTVHLQREFYAYITVISKLVGL